MPLGLGTPEDPPDVPVGVTTASRYIDPSTGELEIDATTGHLRQCSRVMQQVLLALRTKQGSALVDRLFGYKSPTKMTPRFEAEVDAQMRAALRHLTDVQKCMTIKTIAVTRGKSARYAVALRFRNHETDEVETLRLQ